MEQKKNEFRVYVGSYGDYASGIARGGWISLPVSDAELEEFLETVVGINEFNEEPMIQDCEIKHFHLGEDDIYAVNEAAKAWEQLNPKQQDACIAYADSQEITNAEELANLFIKADEIPYKSYNFPNVEKSDYFSKEEKLGYSLIENSGLTYTLQTLMLDDRHNVDEYLDVERYANDQIQTGYFEVYDNGYIDCCSKPLNLQEYSLDEIRGYNNQYTEDLEPEFEMSM